MSSVNKAILVGNLGRDPEAKSFQNGGELVKLSIATSESWKDRNSGERKERTEWHTVIVMNEALCRVAKQYLRKGSKIYVEGQLRTRKWQHSDGGDRWSTEIVLNPFNSVLVLLDRPSGEPGRNDFSGHADDGRWQSGGAGSAGGGRPIADDLDDDVPF